jgi:hypothetical protein
MFWRITGGVVLGLALYWILFLVLGVSIGLLWTDYRDAARVMMQEQSFRLFTLPMFLMNYVVFAAAGAVAGWVSTRISKTIMSALIATAILFIYAGTEHYALLWGKLPDWYNLTIPLVITGLFWLGSWGSHTRARATRE